MKDTVQTMKLHQRLAQAISGHGVTHVYGLVGDANLFMVDSYVDAGLGRYVPCTHEGNAVLAAIGFAQTTGRTGVATITHGPALTNVSTALAEAARGGIPLVVLPVTIFGRRIRAHSRISQDRRLRSGPGVGAVQRARCREFRELRN
mgnify:CR=1 FL=1